MGRPAKICVVGSANVDLSFRTARLPRPGETVAGSAFHSGLGGKGANQAVAAARLGAKTAFIARIGDDVFGRQAVERYAAEGIDVAFVIKDRECPTGTAGIIVDDAAENCIIVVPGANGALTAEDVRRATPAIESADAVLCQLETPLATTREAFRLAREAGVRTVLTPAPARELPDDVLRLCDVCVPNATEIEFLTGRAIANGVEPAAAALRSRGIGTVVVTLGKRGAFVLDNEGGMHVPAIAVEAVDPTGAGDALTAGLAVFLAEGFSLRDAVRRACVVGALAVTRVGAIDAFPSRADVEKVIV